ncbi:class II aldolase and adducin N-terminal domain-containing protein [Poseidonibacter lekithochrous]|uniref:class II aldolase and adducin N-terminal domain-containing protein n=1 Tax=Poseidonibacter TaxID=2321187 RepID=UPI001C08009D|nr:MULTISPECIES: class II aldolase and adducin N-terminal domain-containing protein [Poseidonibacter]MBU3013564.1 class II aldolase and adducin N-terminal domain-containing protein [Poseidonibacter lekithochrous]MDO6826861.1 class II aldolase and adducin N-terminal domain-containing protein [Poseidonibacter sp. 1_MG-2023]
MVDKATVKQLSNLSLTMFRKNFFGIYHGAISAKLDQDNFLINTNDAIFDEMNPNSFCTLNINKQDYRWKIASMESHIHATIYTNIHEAKYIAFGMPIYTTAYTFDHDTIIFEDYFGKTTFNEIPIYDPGDSETWYDRNALEITKYLKESSNNVMVIKGVGAYVYDRDLNELVKKIAILENSCRLLSIKTSFC